MQGMMQDNGMKCPRCCSDKVCKNGHKNGKQRFLCKKCRRQFVEFRTQMGYDEAFKTICLQAYRNGKSFREIERLYAVHHTTVIAWVKQAGFDLAYADSSNPNRADSSFGSSRYTQPNAEDADLRAAILSGALHVFTTQNYATASMSQVSTAAGVSNQILDFYFKDKASLFSALIRQRLNQINQGLLSLSVDNDLPASPEVALRRVAIALLAAFSEDKTLSVMIRLLIGESGRFPELARHFVREVEKPIFEQLSTYLKFHPDVQIGDPTVATRIFVGSLMHYSLVQTVLQGQDILPLERDRLVDGLIANIMATEPQPNAS